MKIGHEHRAIVDGYQSKPETDPEIFHVNENINVSKLNPVDFIKYLHSVDERIAEFNEFIALSNEDAEVRSQDLENLSARMDKVDRKLKDSQKIVIKFLEGVDVIIGSFMLVITKANEVLAIMTFRPKGLADRIRPYKEPLLQALYVGTMAISITSAVYYINQGQYLNHFLRA